MKQLLLSIFLFATLTAVSQQTVIRRITTRTETIPASDTVQGLVKIDTAYSTTYKYLRYIGTTDLRNLYTSGSIGQFGFMWIYVPTATSNYFAKVLAITQVGDATVDTFRIQVDRIMAFTTSTGVGFKSMVNKLYGYKVLNDGGATGTVDGVNVLNLTSFGLTKNNIDGTAQTPWQEPVKVVATTTSFLVIERKGQ